ncbi:318_t:CDS:2 [Entrophospora sp. SA101]|nr:318_t:CDS:2 [Entrophospora sp. SA101]CAJ0890648.1 5984_t:CDS:2 [Entrophospora sp. SA101]
MEFLASAPPPIIKPNIYNVDPKNATLVPLNIAIRIFVKRLETNLNKKNVHKADLLTHWIMVIKDEWGNFDLKKIINREWKTGDVPKVLLQRNFRIKKKQNSWKIQASLLEKNKKPKVDKDKIFKQEEKEIENINDNVKQINLEDITIKEVENKKIKSISWADEVNEEFGEVSSITRNNNEDDVNDDYMNNNVTENETTPIKNHLTQIEEIEPYNSANVIVTINDSQIECDSVSSSNNTESTNLGEEGGGEVADQSIGVGRELVLGFNHNDNYPEKLAIDGIEIINPNDPTTRAINNNDTRPNNTINHTFQWNCDYGNDVSITGTFEEGLIVSANDVVYNDDIRQSSNLQSHAALIYKELQGELETRQLIYEIDSKLHISEAPKGKDKKRGQKLKAYKQQLLNHSIRLQDGEKRIILHKFEKILDVKSYYDELSSSFLLSSSDYINI